MTTRRVSAGAGRRRL